MAFVFEKTTHRNFSSPRDKFNAKQLQNANAMLNAAAKNNGNGGHKHQRERNEQRKDE